MARAVAAQSQSTVRRGGRGPAAGRIGAGTGRRRQARGQRHPWRRILAALGAVVFACGGAHGEESISETEVRSVFLYNFANFVRWPESAARAAPRPFRYCVLDESLAPVLERVLRGEQVEGRAITLAREVSPEDLPGCHVLYVGRSRLQSGLGWDLVHAGMSAQVLTVSDLEGFETRGGMVALVRQGRRIRPSVNVDAVERGSLRVSAKLLSLATVTRDPEASN